MTTEFENWYARSGFVHRYRYCAESAWKAAMEANRIDYNAGLEAAAQRAEEHKSAFRNYQLAEDFSAAIRSLKR